MTNAARGDVPSDAAFRGRCRTESTPDGRVAVKDEVLRVKAADLLGRVSVAGLAELQQIIQLVEQSLDEPGLQVPPGWP